jgi:ribosomal protein S18 acetylase RimI-like enzyme
MEYRRCLPSDLPALLALQNTNLRPGPDAPAQGYLSARLSAEQFLAIARDLALMVAIEDGALAGYLCAARNELSARIPVVAAMLQQLPALAFLGRQLSSQRTFVYGPVCVDPRWRGRGVLRGLYDAFRREIAGDYDAGVLFVAKDNRHSLHAHADGLGMTLVGDFIHDARAFWILAFPVPLPPHC